MAGTHYALVDEPTAGERGIAGCLAMLDSVLWSQQASGPLWPAGRNNIKVVFTAGYTAETCPADLKACLYQMLAPGLGRRGSGGCSTAISRWGTTATRWRRGRV